jgi:hypothetical protein
VVGSQCGLERRAERARLHVEDQRPVVDRHDAVEAGEVEHHAAVDRHAGAAHAAATGGDRQRHPGVVARAGDGRNLVHGSRHRDSGGERHRRGVVGPDHGQGPPVAAGGGDHVGRLLDRAHRRQTLHQRVGNLGDRAPQRAHAICARSAAIDAR